MEEYIPKRKNNFNISSNLKFIYIFVIAFVMVFGVSYGLTFFVQNKKVAEGSMTTGNLTVNFSNQSINATGLSNANDSDGILEFSKTLTVTNTTAVKGDVLVTLTRTSGLALSDMRYALLVNGVIETINDVPLDGKIYHHAILENETVEVEVRLWPKSTYSGSETTFVGTLTPEISYLGATATDYVKDSSSGDENITESNNVYTYASASTNNYVYFNCSNGYTKGSNCETWRIVKVEDDRLVLTRQADYSNAASRTNSNTYNTSLSFNDSSMISSVSTDDKNVYLYKTVKIVDGTGTSTDPFVLSMDTKSTEDHKVIGTYTYRNDSVTVFEQDIYYGENNYISHYINDSDFGGWTDGTNDYNVGDVITYTTNKTLDAIMRLTPYGIMRRGADTTTLINFELMSTASNGQGLYILPGTANDTYPIYYYRGNITNNNVVFGGFCWKMVRTTDTGGTKIIYNGQATVTGSGDNISYDCSSTGSVNIGNSTFNSSKDSLADVGYMYNERYPYQTKSYLEPMLKRTSLKTTYWYSPTVTWGSPTANKYNLDSPHQVTSTSEYSNLRTEYTFRNVAQNHTYASVNYIAAVDGSMMYYFELTDTGNHTLADFNHTYTYGDSYEDKGNGTYEIKDTNNVVTINRSDWYTNYSNFTNKYVCKNATNNICSEVWYVVSTTKEDINYIKIENYKFANGISSYNSTNHTYTLNNTNSVTFWNIADSTNKTSLNNAHYTCWNETGECQTLSYIYYISGGKYYYINLEGGDTIEDALYKMTGNGSAATKTKNASYVLNTTSSKVKIAIENWFKTNLTNEVDINKTNYQVYLEDTIFCNDRSYKTTGNDDTYIQGGWNPNGGSVSSHTINFGTTNRLSNLWYSTSNVPAVKNTGEIPNIACPNETDRFSVSSSVAHLNYPVGLLTADELVMAGGAGRGNTQNKTYYLYSENKYYWTLSPYDFYMTKAYVTFECAGQIYVNHAYGVDKRSAVRPVVSLKPGTEFEDGGVGSPTQPYVVKYD